MKKILISFLTTFCFYANAQVLNYQNGDLVDNFTVTDINGVQHSLYDITATGKYVYLDFFFVDCPPCQATYPRFAELYDKYGCNEGDIYSLSMSDLNGDTNELIREFQEDFGGQFNHPPAAGPSGGTIPVAENFGIWGYPIYCLIGPDNKMVARGIAPHSTQAFVDALPDGVDPQVMECTSMDVSDIDNSELTLYPTVSDGSINLKFAKQANSKVLIFDASGKKVYDKKFSNSNSIDLNLNLSSGLYFMRVEFDNGKIAVKKFFIK